MKCIKSVIHLFVLSTTMYILIFTNFVLFQIIRENIYIEFLFHISFSNKRQIEITRTLRICVSYNKDWHLWVHSYNALILENAFDRIRKIRFSINIRLSMKILVEYAKSIFMMVNMKFSIFYRFYFEFLILLLLDIILSVLLFWKIKD